MNERDVDQALEELRAALLVEPSREFAPQVRARIDRERRRVWPRRIAWGGLAVATAAAIVIVATRPPTTVNVATPAPALVSARADAAPAHAGVDPGSGRASVAVVHSTLRSRRQVEPIRVTEPEVLVPGDQEIALRRMLIALSEGRIAPPPSAARLVADADGMPRPAAINIPRIAVEALPAPAGGGGER